MIKKATFLLLLFIFCFSLVVDTYAIVPTKPTTADPTGDITNPVSKLWGNFQYVVQVICIGCVVFAGVRYMFASSDKRADLKKGLGYLTIGSVIVFGAVTIIQAIANII